MNSLSKRKKPLLWIYSPLNMMNYNELLKEQYNNLPFQKQIKCFSFMSERFCCSSVLRKVLYCYYIFHWKTWCGSEVILGFCMQCVWSVHPPLSSDCEVVYLLASELIFCHQPQSGWWLFSYALCSIWHVWSSVGENIIFLGKPIIE